MTYDDATFVDKDEPVDAEGRCRLCGQPWPNPADLDDDSGERSPEQ